MKIADFAGQFYRAKQTSVTGILLAEKNADLMSALLNLCQENAVPIPEAGRSEKVNSKGRLLWQN